MVMILLWWQGLSPNTRKAIILFFVSAILLLIGYSIYRKLKSPKQSDVPNGCEETPQDYQFIDELHSALKNSDETKLEQLYSALRFADECKTKNYANIWNKTYKGKDGCAFGLCPPWGNLYQAIEWFGCDTSYTDFSGINDCNLYNTTLNHLASYGINQL